jgi:tetratricopeptide (TPR) repeat protein
MKNFRALVAALLIILGASTHAHAEHVDDVEAARAHYAKGKRLYDLGRFPEAAKEYEAAYQAKDDPALLFNLGQAHRLAGNHPQALLAYKAYIRNVPGAQNRREVEARINEMQVIVEHQTRTNQSPPQGTIEPRSLEAPSRPSSAGATATSDPASSTTLTTSAPPAKTPIYKKWWLWTAVGLVAVGVGLGVGLGVEPKDPSPTLMGVTF